MKKRKKNTYLKQNDFELRKIQKKWKWLCEFNVNATAESVLSVYHIPPIHRPNTFPSEPTRNVTFPKQ